MSVRKQKTDISLAKLLPLLVRDKGWEKQLDLYSIFDKWNEIIGEDVSLYAKPLKIDRGVLWLEVENSSWLQQFQYEKLDFLDALNSFLKIARLKDIKMVLPKGKKKEPERKKSVTVTFVRPPEEKIAAFERQVQGIEDEKCREALMQFWYLSQACKRTTK